MLGSVKQQVNEAEDVVNAVKPLISIDGVVDQQALATLTGAIIIAAQLNNLASSIDTREIADAIAAAA